MGYAEDILEHYGVKGMKWGARKADGSGTGPHPSSSRVNKIRDHLKKEIAERTSTEVTVRAKPGSMVRAVGGMRRLPHQDAINARVSEQVAKRSTLDSLSNKDLQHLVNRMNLESQYRNLASKETRASAGEKMVLNLLSEKGDVFYKRLGPLASVGKKLVEGAVKGSNKAMSGGIVGKDKEKNK